MFKKSRKTITCLSVAVLLVASFSLSAFAASVQDENADNAVAVVEAQMIEGVSFDENDGEKAAETVAASENSH